MAFGARHLLLSPSSSLDILLVLYREEKALKNLNEDLEKQSFRNFQVFLSLNAPTKEGEERTREQYPSWNIFPGKNDGYAGGLQRVWPQGGSPWVLCANTDLHMKKDFLEKMMAAAEEVDADVGLISPKIFYPDGRLQSAGGLLLGPEGLCRPRGMGEKDRGQYDHLKDIVIVSGCCFLVRRKLLEDIGGFDGSFFMYMEDVEFCLRALWAGWQAVYRSELSVIHEHGGASERYGALQLYHLERNHWWIFHLFPFSMTWKMPFLNLFRWSYLFFKGDASWKLPRGSSFLAFKALFAGCLGFLLRRRIESPRRITSKEFLEKIRKHRIGFFDFLAAP
jgi:GT2 family glycosyltransferase